MKSTRIAALLMVAGGLSVVGAPATAGVPCGPSGFSNTSNSISTAERQRARAERKARKEQRKAEKRAAKEAAAKAANASANPESASSGAK